jgi:carbonic anhydrase
MSKTEEFLANAREWEANFANASLPMPPATHVSVVTCMDARLDPARIFGFGEGDAHVIRNAGGVVTDDVIRSLAVSQRLLGTEEIVLLHHTDCGMLTFTDEEFLEAIEQDAGERPAWASEAFADVYQDVQESLQLIDASPFVPRKDQVRGFVHDDQTGRVIEVTRKPVAVAS